MRMYVSCSILKLLGTFKPQELQQEIQDGLQTFKNEKKIA